MPDTHRLLLEMENGVARIRFDRPQTLNAIDVAMAEQLLAALTQLRSSGAARVIVLSGQGRAFMAGGDLQNFFSDLENADKTARAMIDPLHAAIELMAKGDAPVIASVHGAVAGAGISLALGADLAIAADDAKFNMAYARVGANMDGGASWALARVVGLRRAMEIALLSDVIDAPTALQLGLVNRVVPAQDLERETLALAARLAQGPTLAFGRIRRLLRDSHRNDLATQLRLEGDAFVAGTGTQDFTEGLTAFFAKRSPKFTGT
jgi:2-(1,2-epoxy-1,2-dihydrophenyl)acetyl-CoA isomerase